MNFNENRNDIRSTSQIELQIIDEKIQNHEAEVAAMEASLEALRSRRRELDEERNRALPMSKLPLEVLIEIFFLVCQSSQNTSLKIPGPFLIGRVCRSWRRTAWTTPKFWTHISLEFSAARCRTQVELLQEWIQRTAGCLLHLEIDKHRRAGEEEWEPPKEVFDILLESSEQWESLRLAAFEDFFKAVDRNPHAQFASLKKLVFVNLPWQPPIDQTSLLLKLTCPLEQLVFGPKISLRNLDLNWSCLQSVDASLYLSDCFELLKQCESLQRCNLIIRQAQPGMPAVPTRRIVLQHLTSLELYGQDQTFPGFLQYLEVPNLTTLQIFVWRKTRADVCWVTALTEMAQRCRFPLVDLTIFESTQEPRSPEVSEEDILDMLATFPDLKHVVLHLTPAFSLSDTTISRLVVDTKKCDHAPGGVVAIGDLPRVETLEYTGRISFTLNALLEMLTSRAALLNARSPRGDPPSSAAGMKDKAQFHMKVKYMNQDWYREKKPNDLPDFYNNLLKMSDAVRLELCYNTPR